MSYLGGPKYNAPHPDDASAGDLDRVRRVLRAAERARTIRPGGRRPFWATEFWWRSKPPGRNGVSLDKQARWLAQSLYVFWDDGAKAAFYFTLDDGDELRWDTGLGLFTKDGVAKPAYRAFTFPFVTDRISRRRVLAWGKAPRGGKVRIQRLRKEGWRTLKRRSVDPGQIFTAKLRVGGKAKLRAVIGQEQSLIWTQRR